MKVPKLRVLLMQSSGVWVALGLEHCISAHAATLDRVVEVFFQQLSLQVLLDVGEGLAPLEDTPPAAAEFWEYLRRRVILGATFAAVDQATIASTLVYQATSTLAAGGFITVPGTPTAVGAQTYLVPPALHGVTRDRSYYAWENKPVGEAVEQLSAVINGFDFAIDLAKTSTGISRTFRTFYPRRGALAAATGHVWEFGRNMVDYQWPVDGTRFATHVFGLGSGEGLAALRSVQANTSAIDAGWPQWDAPVALKDYTVQANLDAATRSTLNAIAAPLALPSITVRGDTDPALGAWAVGDDCRIRIRDERFPAGIDVARRIVGYEATPADGAELVKLTLADPTTF